MRFRLPEWHGRIADCRREKQQVRFPANQKEDASIVLTEPFKTRRGLTVENGIAFEKAKVQLKNFKKLVVPKDATIRAEGEPGTMLIYMAKTLAFVGQTPQPMSIRESRNFMGCATKSEAGTDAVIVATFGEWDSHIEGGAVMKLVLIVPKDIEVKRKTNLSGENSVAIDRRLRRPARRQGRQERCVRSIKLSQQAAGKLLPSSRIRNRRQSESPAQ